MLGQRLRGLRQARGITLQQIGDAVGVTRSAVYDWEKGRSQLPSAEIPRIAEALGVTVADLYGESVAGTPRDTARRDRIRDALLERWVGENWGQSRRSAQRFIHLAYIYDEAPQKPRRRSRRSTLQDTPLVYFIRRESDGAVKIGYVSRAAGLGGRLDALRSMYRTEMRLLLALPGARERELALHERFREHRIDGEWFVPHGELAALLALAGTRDI